MENKYDKNIESLLQKAFLLQDLDAAKNETLLAASSQTTLDNVAQTAFFSSANLFKGLFFLATLFGVVFGWNRIFEAESRYTPNEFSYQLPVANVEELNNIPTLTALSLEGNKFDKNIKNATVLGWNESAEKEELIKVYKPEKQQYDIKILSGKEIKEHFKEKEKFIEDVLKLDKKKITKVKVFSQYLQHGEKVLINFAIWRTEITNVEYRLFLNDLIVQNRKVDYVLASVNETGWTEAFAYAYSKPMDSLYFKHPAYDDYPVVNVPLEGVQLYCEWITKEIHLIGKNKFFLDKVRLPTEVEWEYLASSGGKFDPYPWGGPYIRNSDGSYLANFRPLKDNFAIDGAMFTAKVDSYNPNNFGLYNISGNAAELVVNAKTGKFGVKGGSWFDAMEQLKIKRPLRYIDSIIPHPTIGFRPVLTFK